MTTGPMLNIHWKHLPSVSTTSLILSSVTNRHDRQETDRFRRFSYDEIIARDKTSLDVFWLKNDSLGDLDNLPDPDLLALDIVENLETALGSFRQIVTRLQVEA